jgi:hypothetical protein
MRKIRSKLTYSNVISTLCLFLILGGGAYAASQINGKSIKRHSIPGNRLKNNTVKGRQVKESSLGTVPKAATAAAANSADNSAALGGVPKSGFGEGVINGSVFDFNGTGPTTYLVQPYGIFDLAAIGGDQAVEAIAPVDMTVRDFVGEAANGFGAGESISFGLQITPPGQGPATVPLCTVSNVQSTCRSNGPIAVPRDATYRLSLGASALSGNESVGYQYRDAAG